MAFADYDFYFCVYRGNAISKSDFDRLITRAGSYLNSVKTVGVLPDCDSVRMAECAVAEVWLKIEQGGELQSQSVGGWSLSFATSGKSDNSRLFDAAKMYIPDFISKVRWI